MLKKSLREIVETFLLLRNGFLKKNAVIRTPINFEWVNFE